MLLDVTASKGTSMIGKKNRKESKFKLNRDIEININFLMSTAHMMRGDMYTAYSP